MSERISRLVAIIFVALGFLAGTSPTAFCTNVGFEKIQIANGSDAPLTGGVWYPTAAKTREQALGLFAQDVARGAQVSGSGLPLIVISHGGGSSYEAHYDTALALAQAGFVAASINHTGDTYDDQRQVLQLWRRPSQLHRLVSYMLAEWSQRGRLDAAQVGAFGFSNGGFTVLVAAGGIPDLNKTASYCHDHPAHDLCRALERARVDPHLGADISPGVWTHDWRIKAAVVVAPAFGFAFDLAGLKNVRIPIQLWRAANDHHQPDPWYEEAVRLALPHPPDYHIVADGGHYDFLPPCSARLMALNPEICSDPPHFDRVAFHHAFNAQIVRFFQITLH
jgi:predicted dienelactone hydrolase